MATRDELNRMTPEQLLATYKDLKVSNAVSDARNQARAELLPNPIQSFKAKLDRDFVPSNIGELSKVYWGFIFTLRKIIVSPGQTMQVTLNISEDASFCVKEIQKCIFSRTGAFGSYVYSFLDSEIHDDANLASGLSWSLQDLQSKRVFKTYGGF